jgi:hypothetical protein
MGKRAAVVFSVLAVAVLQWLASTTVEPPQQFYMIAPPLASQQRAAAPQMMTPTWDYEVATDTDEVQRRVMERLLRHGAADTSTYVKEVSEDAPLQSAVREVRGLARSFGEAEGDFADKWLARVMATEDPKARLEILDECFINLEEEAVGGFDCKGLDLALRRFRLLLAPHTYKVKNAKMHVRALEAKLDRSKQNHVEAWMKSVERGGLAEDPSQVLDECSISSKWGGPRSRDCFEFEEALRDYKRASDAWAFQP